jgi:putative transposase
MIQVERHIITQKHSLYTECDELCYKSKNLYNQGLYNVRQHYFNTTEYLSYNIHYHVAKTQESYIALPAKVSNQTLKMVDNNFKTFFALLKLKQKGSYSEKVSIPNYLDKDGRYVIKYEKQALGSKEFKKANQIKLSKTNIVLNTKVTNWDSIKEVRIVPKGNHYVIEVVYEKEVKETIISNNIASIDLGLNNLCTVTFNNGEKPLVINGKPLKSINQYYNKERSRLQSELELKQHVKTSKRITNLNNKRNNKVTDYLHNASRLLVNQLAIKRVSTLIIGNNKGWKQDINIGKRNNQNFVSVPHSKLIELIKYKCELEGITVIIQEESYTSKCSFLDNEPIQKHDEYKGSRIKRGLFKSSDGTLINADVNGSYNIMKKAIPNAFANGIEGVAVHPIKLKV